MKQAAEARHKKALAAKESVRRKLEEDKSFCVLYAAVALTFAEQLRQDLANLQAGRQVIRQSFVASFYNSGCIHVAWPMPLGSAFTRVHMLPCLLGYELRHSTLQGDASSGIHNLKNMQMHAGVLPVRQVGAHPQAGPRQPVAHSHGHSRAPVPGGAVPAAGHERPRLHRAGAQELRQGVPQAPARGCPPARGSAPLYLGHDMAYDHADLIPLLMVSQTVVTAQIPIRPAVQLMLPGRVLVLLQVRAARAA